MKWYFQNMAAVTKHRNIIFDISPESSESVLTNLGQKGPWLALIKNCVRQVHPPSNMAAFTENRNIYFRHCGPTTILTKLGQKSLAKNHLVISNTNLQNDTYQVKVAKVQASNMATVTQYCSKQLSLKPYALCHLN